MFVIVLYFIQLDFVTSKAKLKMSKLGLLI